MSRFLWICLGGAVGSGARYLLSGWVQRTLGSAFPFGTLSVNLIGSFLICALMQLAGAEWLSPTLRLTLTIGFLGGFTTYSTFNYETFRLVQEGAGLLAAMNVGITVFACFLAGMLGDSFGRMLLR